MKSIRALSCLCRDLRPRVAGVSFALLACTAPAHAALPSVSFAVDSFYLGGSVTLAPTVADADADIDYVTFSVLAPGTSGWASLSPDVNVLGAGTSAQQNGVTVQKTWSPSSPGLWTVRVTAHSLNGSTSVERTLDVLADTQTVGARTVLARWVRVPPGKPSMGHHEKAAEPY